MEIEEKILEIPFHQRQYVTCNFNSEFCLGIIETFKELYQAYKITFLGISSGYLKDTDVFDDMANVELHILRLIIPESSDDNEPFDICEDIAYFLISKTEEDYLLAKLLFDDIIFYSY